MRKNVILSLLAATSASMGAYASADLSSFIKTSDTDLSQWTSAKTGIKLESGLFTATDKTVTLSQTIKGLLPGSYQLTTTTNENDSITINGKTYTDGKFSLSSTQDVEIKAVSKDGTNGFRVGGFTLTLIFDFSKAAEELTYNLRKVVDAIDRNGANYAALYAEGAAIGDKINAIDKSQNGGADAYAVYSSDGLYPGGTNTIQPLINTFSAKVKNDNAYQTALTDITAMNASLATAWTSLNNPKGYAYGKYKSVYDEISNTISTFKTTADAAFAEGTAGTLTTPNVLASITTLISNIATANQNDIDYTAVAAQIVAVKTSYNAAFQNLVTVLTGVYSDKLAAAQAELKPVLDKIAAIEAKNGSPQTEKNPNSHDGATASKEQNLNDLQTASTSINNINTYYSNQAAGFKASYATATGELATLKANLAAVDITGVTTVTDDISTINGNISTLSANIEAANKDHSITDLLIKADYIALKNTINIKITALSAKVLNFNTNKTTVATIQGLLDKLNRTKSTVQALADGNYTVRTKYATTENTLQGTIGTSDGNTGYFGAAKTAYNNGRAVEYATNSAASFTATSAAIDAYLANAQAGVAAYNQIVDSIASYNAELEKLKETTKIPDVSTISGSTYGAEILRIQTAITGFSNSLTTALNLSDKAHHDGLIALQGTIVTDFYNEVDSLCDAYSVRETNYKQWYNQNTATTMRNEASKRVSDLLNDLRALPTTYTPEAIGVSNTKFTERLEALKGRVEVQQSKIGNTVPTADAIGTIATIDAVNGELAQITVDENNLKSYGDLAIANVKQKNTADGIVNDLTTKAGHISTGTDPSPSKQAVFSTLKSKQIDRLRADSAIIAASYNAETLVADWAKISTRLTAIGVTTDSINTAVTAANTNYNAMGIQTTAVSTANFTGLINTATDGVKSVTSETGAGATYYISNLLSGYQNQVVQINADITSYYRAGTSASHTTEITDRIKNLKTFINGVKALAQANDAAYQAQKSQSQTVQNYFGDVYYKISTQDKSSIVKTYLDSLVVLQANLNALNTLVDNAFGQGLSVARNTVLFNDYTAINILIKDVEDRQSLGYNSAITADNKEQYKTIKLFVNATQDVYNQAVTIINKYSNIKNAEYKVAIDEIIKSSQKIYAYASKITDLNSDIDTTYNGTKSPDLFDISTYQTTANNYQASITQILSDFRRDAKQKAIDYFDNHVKPAAAGKLSDAKNRLQGYAAAVVDAAFSDVQGIISAAQNMRDNNADLDFALDLDGIITSYNTIDGLLDKDYEPAANAQWKYYKEILDRQIEIWKKSNGYKLLDYQRQIDEQIGHINAQCTTVTQDISSNTLFANLSTSMTTIEGYKVIVQGNNGLGGLVSQANAAYAVIAANNQASSDMVNKIKTDVQPALNKAKDYVIWYCSSSSPSLVSAISGYQSQIDALSVTATDIVNASANKATFMTDCGTLVNAINNTIYSNANSIEMNTLTEKISVLKNDFNLALAALKKDTVVLASDPRVAPYWTKIQAYQTELNTISSNYDKAVTLSRTNAVAGVSAQQALRLSLVNLEQNIAYTHTDLVKIYDATLASSIFATLSNAIGTVETNYTAEVNNLAGYDAKVKVAYSLDGIGKAITAAKDSISHRNAAGMLLFYSDNISGYISSISTNLSTVTEAIETMQRKITANNNAYNLLTGQIKDIESRLASVETVISSYKYPYSYDLTIINNDIRDAKNDVDTRNLAGTLTSASTLLYKDDIYAAIGQLEKKAAYNEATHSIDALSNAKNAASVIINNNYMSSIYSSAIYGVLQARLSGIVNAIDNLKKYDDEAKTNYISHDIDGTPILDENGLPTQKGVVYIDVYNKEIVAKITALNGDIATLSFDADYTLGDVTNDGSVLVDDYNTIKGYVLAPTMAPTSTSGRTFNTADVNKDGNINIGDVTAVANIIINRGSTASARAMRIAAVASTDAITLSSANEGTTQRIAINLKNSTAYVACQMDIKLPAGMTLVGESLSGRANGHTLSSNNLNDGSHRVVISTVENNSFNDTESAILYLDVNTVNSSDIDKVSVSNIMFTDAEARVYNFADLTSGSATGINGVKADQGIGSKIYSVGGKLLNTLQKGVNIIRNADGSTKKIINK